MVYWYLLPEEIIQIIINYTDIVIYRHGKYINRINKEDYRYENLEYIKKPIFLSKTRWVFYFKLFNGENIRGFCCEHRYDDDKHFLTIDEILKKEDGSIEYKNVKHSDKNIK
jgi:hypothetical protein